MKLSRKKLFKGRAYPIEIEHLLLQAEKALKTWEPIWTLFTPAPIREQTLKLLNEVADISFISNGGFPNAERQRILFQRREQEELILEQELPISGIEIQGNFLFDRTNPNDFLNALRETKVKPNEIGDIFLTGDRGAQAICTPSVSKSLNNTKGIIRDVEIEYKALSLEDLRLPTQRLPKTIKTVEASKRLDAIASAGFGLSRAKIIKQIQAGKLRLNWHQVNNPSRQLQLGDKIQLEGKGSIEILHLELTKRERWRVELQRQ
ncbi:photosystem II S4 domain protein [Prochlorococcus marinus]|uniref:photosystem II S4 domain protein n=1 Tax=Prochlorococcus marinus TaxID=1219 RepID=UPI0022B4F717|nr:photosystem II S4 domain protein [Prochlorococcus marinus]